jgi:protein-arginine kinase activator protein McsA
VGRRPQHARGDMVEPQTTAKEKTVAKPQDERERLQAELKKAVQEERYERAAELRDRLRALGGECS